MIKNPEVGEMYLDDGRIYVYNGKKWNYARPAITITKKSARYLLDFFDNGNHDIYNKKQWEAFEELRRKIKT